MVVICFIQDHKKKKNFDTQEAGTCKLELKNGLRYESAIKIAAKIICWQSNN